MKTHLIAVLAALIAAMPSCTKLRSGESFNASFDGIEYNFEVIVSRMSYVRLSPVSGPDVVRGNIVLPTTADFDGDTYTVTQIAERAFMDYTGITAVTLPKTLSTIEPEAFAGCTQLVSINTPQPLSVIGDYAFAGCRSLTAFSLEASISNLGIGAFRDCASLRELVFTPTFTTIPAELCLGCTSLGYIEFPATILSIGESAFEGCASAESIYLDSSVQTIGSRAFYGCGGVRAITSKTPTPPACYPDTFGVINPGVPVTVPMANVEQYMNAVGWNYFTNYYGQY